MEGKVLIIEVKGSEKTSWTEKVYRLPPKDKGETKNTDNKGEKNDVKSVADEEKKE